MQRHVYLGSNSYSLNTEPYYFLVNFNYICLPSVGENCRKGFSSAFAMTYLFSYYSGSVSGNRIDNLHINRKQGNTYCPFGSLDPI